MATILETCGPQRAGLGALHLGLTPILSTSRTQMSLLPLKPILLGLNSVTMASSSSAAVISPFCTTSCNKGCAHQACRLCYTYSLDTRFYASELIRGIQNTCNSWRLMFHSCVRPCSSFLSTTQTLYPLSCMWASFIRPILCCLETFFSMLALGAVLIYVHCGFFLSRFSDPHYLSALTIGTADLASD